MSCDGLGVHPLQWLWTPLRSHLGIPRWTSPEGRSVIYTYQGRNAIALFCRLIGLRPGDEVLAPAYNCGAEIDPFVRAGAQVVLYDVDEWLKIDIERIAASITGSTRVVHVTHYFGFGQRLDRLAEACRARGVFLVEDCAQALFSDPSGILMGRTGDAAVYSFVKSLAAPDGGALVVDSRVTSGEPRLVPPPLRATLRGSLPLVKRWFSKSSTVSRAFRRGQSLLGLPPGGATASDNHQSYPPMLKSNYFVQERAEWAMSRVARAVLQSSNAADIVRARRRNFEYLMKALTDVAGFTSVTDSLPEGACPLAFPFLVEDRAHWYRHLQARGILIQGWPGYYPGLDWEACPGACRLKDKLLTLPVHQGLSLRHMDYIVDCIHDVAGLAPSER
jgi:dTDP-4-amino-4,6-dideoxygalactose transaminase